MFLSWFNLNGDGVEAVVLKQGLGDVFQNLLTVHCVCNRQQAEYNQIEYSVIV